MENEKRYCDCCGAEIAEYSGTWVEGELLCDCCVEEHCITCDHCEETIWTNECIEDGDTFLCHDCYENHYYRCERCNSIIHTNSVNWHYDLPYCEECYNDVQCDDEIEEYNYKPDPIFYGDGTRYFGVELEVDNGGKDDSNALKLKDIANYHNEHIYIKSDGSIDDGFEIVSHPMTLDYHKNDMDWESVMHEAVKMNYRSHQTDTCGLHIHVNRDSFGRNQSEQEEVISRILYFIEKFWGEMFRFSRRTEYNMNRWSARYGLEKTGKQILEKAKNGNFDRYTAVNLSNYRTIEFRLFRGTLKYNTFIATLQMVNHICDVAFSMSQDKLEELSWSEFVGKITESELIQYLKERRIYINEEVSTEEEM